MIKTTIEYVPAAAGFYLIGIANEECLDPKQSLNPKDFCYAPIVAWKIVTTDTETDSYPVSLGEGNYGEFVMTPDRSVGTVCGSEAFGGFEDFLAEINRRRKL